MKMILWQNITPDIEQCHQNTHVLLLFTHRMQIFINEDTENHRVKDFLQLTGSRLHFYFHALEGRVDQSSEMYTYDTNVSNMFATDRNWWSPVHFSDFHPHPRSESMLLSSLYALRLYFTRQVQKNTSNIFSIDI